MASTIPQLQERLQLVHRAYPDKRTRQHKQAIQDMYELTIQELHDKLMNETAKTKKLMSRAATASFQNDSRSSCAICMDEMKGRVSLVCGHEMCPECFAQHARLHNTCPFCRDQFAPKPKIPNKMPIHHIDIMAEQWADSMASSDCLTSQRVFNHSLRGGEADVHLMYFVVANAKILMQKVKRWYDQEIP